MGSHPLPNAVVENPVNGHAHAVWALEEAVTRTEYARRKPLALCRRCDRGTAPRAGRRCGVLGADDEEPAPHGLEHRVAPRRPPHARRLGRGAGRPYAAFALAGDQAVPYQHHGPGA
ncbi:replication initiation protein [Streptomyces sp. HNA39]|nr:replication initiation protein [Streptomyces sp. HNA39]